MVVSRILAFLFFLLLGGGIVVWQWRHVDVELAASYSIPASLMLMGLSLVLLLVQTLGLPLVTKRDRTWILVLAGLPVLPLTALGAGILSLIQLKGGNLDKLWRGACWIGALVGLNIALPLIAGHIFIGGSAGLAASWLAIKFAFFVVVDVFLGRAILHYFNSGASPFISLRYLRRRVISLLATFGIALGVLVLIEVNSVMTGFQTQFREEMRGSLSHVLIRLDSRGVAAMIDENERYRAEWSAYVKRIESTAELTLPWQKALEDALARYRNRDGDMLPDPADFAPAQPALPGDDTGPPADAPTLTQSDREYLQRLRSGAGLSTFDRECLRDEGIPVTPREFYLSRVPEPSKEEEKVKQDWYSPLFRKALDGQYEAVSRALRGHVGPDGKPDVEGISLRVSTKTFITPKSGSRELPIAELVGVHPETEPTISNLGRYIGNAETNDFRDQYVLQPMVNVLGALLGWETPDSLELNAAQPVFTFTEDGKRTGPIPSNMVVILSRRHLCTPGGRIRWSDFDRVRFFEFSPAQRIYERVRDAYKEASRTEDLYRLGEILSACEADVGTILRAQLKDTPTDRFTAVNATGARIMLREFMTGASLCHDTLRGLHNDLYPTLRQYLKDGPEEAMPEAEVKLVKGLWRKLDELTKTADARIEDLSISDNERDAALQEWGTAWTQSLRDALASAESARLPTVEMLKQMLAYAHDGSRYTPLADRLRLRMRLPLQYSVLQYANSAAGVRDRVNAYGKVLPLRTTMEPGEDVNTYLQRARTPNLRPDQSMPGVILGDVLAEFGMGGPVRVGDSIAVTIPRIYRGEDGRLVPHTTEVWFRVTGFFRSGLYDENKGRMYCDFDELTRILADSEVRFVVGAKLRDYLPYEGQQGGDRLKADLRKALFLEGVGDAGVGVWEDEARTLLDAVNVERTLIGLIVSFIIVLAGGLILILMYQLVNEKVRDIGILKALGQSPWGIRSIFMFNALFIGLFGAVLGSIAGIVTSEYLNEIEDFIDQWTGIRLFPPEIYYLTYIPSITGTKLIWLAMDIAVPVVMFSFFCGIMPAMSAARKDPVEALQHD